MTSDFQPMTRFMRVIDSRTGITICSGVCKFLKRKPADLVSIDNRFFFHLLGTANYVVEFTDDVSQQSVEFKLEQHQLSALRFDKIYTLSEQQIAEMDVFIEHSIDELDPEVINVVHALNLIDGVETTGSCSGHRSAPPWVIFNLSSLDALSALIWCIQQPKFKHMFQIITDDTIAIEFSKSSQHPRPALKLVAKCACPDAIPLLDTLAAFIKVSISSGLVKGKIG